MYIHFMFNVHTVFYSLRWSSYESYNPDYVLSSTINLKGTYIVRALFPHQNRKGYFCFKIMFISGKNPNSFQSLF